MSVIIRSNQLATRSLGNIDGLLGPRDYSVFADIANLAYRRKSAGSVNAVGFSDIFEFARTTTGQYVPYGGSAYQTASINQPRFHQIPGTEHRGLLMEQPRRNLFRDSVNPQTQSIAVSMSGTSASAPLIVWMEGSGSVTLSGDISAAANGAPSGLTVTATQGSPAMAFPAGGGAVVATVTGSVSHVQVEQAFRVFSATTPVQTDAGNTRLRNEDVLRLLPSLLGAEWTIVVNIVDEFDTLFAPGSGQPDSRQIISVSNAEGDYLGVGRVRAQSSAGTSLQFHARFSGVTETSNAAMAFGRSYTLALGYGSGTVKAGAMGSVRSLSGLPSAFTPARALLATSGDWAQNVTPNGLVTRVVAYPRLLSDVELAAASRSWL